MANLGQWMDAVLGFAEGTNAICAAILAKEERQDALINALVLGQKLLMARVEVIEKLWEESREE